MTSFANTTVAQANSTEISAEDNNQQESTPLTAVDARIAVLQALIGQVIEGVVTNVTEYGVFVGVGNGNKESGLLHTNGMTGNARARLSTIAVGDTLKVTITSVKRKPNFQGKLLIDLSELAIPVSKLKTFVGADTKITGTIIGRFDDYLLVGLSDGLQARLPISKLGGTSLEALKKGVTVKASVFSVEGSNVVLTRESIDSVHARAKREAARAQNRMQAQEFRSNKKSAGGGKKNKK
ncbi:MAG: S1 RNA-binding domain-containing protein [Candidatus Obscuribacterales bacterium]|nr:S1 RNA-binding domain-containing protein [Candidatus Obscuribacterales bacterium]